MAAIFEHCVFIHIPKTGGTTIRSACSDLIRGETDHIEEPSDAKHSSFEMIQGQIGDRPCFATVRGTLDWYRSVWCHRKQRGLDGYTGLLGEELWRDDFPEWIGSVTVHEPGAYGGLLNAMIGESGASLVRTDHLWDDLQSVLLAMGERWRCVRPMMPQNIAGIEQNMAHWTSDLVDRILAVEGPGKYPDVFYERHGDRLGKGLV